MNKLEDSSLMTIEILEKKIKQLESKRKYWELKCKRRDYQYGQLCNKYNMKKIELNLIEDPVDLKILSNIDDKKNITDISTATGYTYKSIFHRIKRLERQGLVELNKTKDITQGAILTIPKDVKEKISHEISRYKYAETDFNKFDKELLKKVTELLKFIEENRLVCDSDVSSFIWKKYYIAGKPESWMGVRAAYDSLINLGMLRSRVEITRAGKQFLKDNYRALKESKK